MYPKIIIFCIITAAFFACAQGGFAQTEVERRDIVYATLDAIEHRLEKRQKKDQHIFSDFSFQSPLLNILSLYQRYTSPILCFNQEETLDAYELNFAPIRRIEQEGKHAWDLGAEISYIKYKEPDVMKQEGAMYGISGSYAGFGQFLSKNFMLKLEGKWSCGQVDYDGALSDGTPYTFDERDDYILEFRGLGGYSYSLLDTFIARPYFGFGYRYLNDAKSGDPYGYERESNYIYSPIGIELMAALENRWFIGLTLEYDHFWIGVQKSHLSDVNPTFNDLENDQNKGYGLRAAARLQKKGERIDFVIEPFIKYWNIKKSEEQTITYSGLIWGYGYEPKNNSTEIGGKIAIKF